MKIAVLGTSFGVVHIQTFLQHPAVKDVIVYSRKQENVERIKAEYQVEGTTDLNQILSDPSVDVVTIALPPHLHASIAIQAMEQGKHVICEVPVSLTLEEALQMQRVSEQTGKRVMVNLFMRFRPAYQHLHHMIQTQRYGNLLSIQFTNKTAPLWGYHPLGLDKLPMESCYCDLDYLYWCAGQMKLIGLTASEFKGESSTIDMVFNSENGIPIQMSSSSMMPIKFGMRERYEAIFEDAVIVYQETSWGMGGSNSPVMIYTNENEESLQLPSTNHYYDSLSYCLAKLINGENGITDLEQSIPALQMVLDINKKLKGD